MENTDPIAQYLERTPGLEMKTTMVVKRPPKAPSRCRKSLIETPRSSKAYLKEKKSTQTAAMVIHSDERQERALHSHVDRRFKAFLEDQRTVPRRLLVAMKKKKSFLHDSTKVKEIQNDLMEPFFVNTKGVQANNSNVSPRIIANSAISSQYGPIFTASGNQYHHFSKVSHDPNPKKEVMAVIEHAVLDEEHYHPSFEKESRIKNKTSVNPTKKKQFSVNNDPHQPLVSYTSDICTVVRGRNRPQTARHERRPVYVQRPMSASAMRIEKKLNEKQEKWLVDKDLKSGKRRHFPRRKSRLPPSPTMRRRDSTTSKDASVSLSTTNLTGTRLQNKKEQVKHEYSPVKPISRRKDTAIPNGKYYRDRYAKMMAGRMSEFESLMRSHHRDFNANSNNLNAEQHQSNLEHNVQYENQAEQSAMEKVDKIMAKLTAWRSLLLRDNLPSTFGDVNLSAKDFSLKRTASYGSSVTAQNSRRDEDDEESDHNRPKICKGNVLVDMQTEIVYSDEVLVAEDRTVIQSESQSEDECTSESSWSSQLSYSSADLIAAMGK